MSVLFSSWDCLPACLPLLLLLFQCFQVFVMNELYFFMFFSFCVDRFSWIVLFSLEFESAQVELLHSSFMHGPTSIQSRLSVWAFFIEVLSESDTRSEHTKAYCTLTFGFFWAIWVRSPMDTVLGAVTKSPPQGVPSKPEILVRNVCSGDSPGWFWSATQVFSELHSNFERTLRHGSSVNLNRMLWKENLAIHCTLEQNDFGSDRADRGNELLLLHGSFELRKTQFTA